MGCFDVEQVYTQINNNKYKKNIPKREKTEIVTIC